MTDARALTRTERVADSDVRYRRRGSGDTAFVFVHGFLDDQYVWDGVIDALTTPGFEYVQLDLAGSGDRTSSGGPFDLTRFAHDVSAVVEALDKPVVLVAQSLGTLVAELVAVDHADRVQGLILLSPVPLAGVHLPEETAEQFRSLGGNAEAQRTVRRQLSVSLSEAELDRLVVVGARVPAPVVRDLVKCWNEGDPRGNSASPYRGPVLIGRGAEDGFVTDEVITAQVLPRFERTETFAVDNAGHWAHVEAPATVAAHVETFVEAYLTILPPHQPETAPGQGGSGWRNAFASKTADDFAAAFSADIALEASVLAIPVEGREKVKATMTQASKIYESLEFVRETAQGVRTYLEWEATAFGGMQIYGVTVLTKGTDGRINHVAIHHRPLGAALRFSVEMRERLTGTVDSSHFHTAE
ncbi:alpha/beta hydrolase [Streptomyces flaveolus]|uniref:Alpha/beta hydrolase n=1 Tax=Streptomyces flaveolus TaxID=67297 RepID=A0ABV1VKU8_9ACTN